MSGYRMALRPSVCTVKGGTSSADGEHARGEPGGGVASPTGSACSGLSWGGEGTGSQDHDLDFHSQMDENGIIGLGELPEELEGGGGAFSDAGTPDPEGGPPPAPASPGFEEEEEEELFEDLSCNISELQDSEPLRLSASLGEEDGHALSLCDSEEMEEDAGSGRAAEGGPWLIHGQWPWRPQSDGQLEMSEDERGGAASAGGASEDRRDSPDDSRGEDVPTAGILDDRWTGGSSPEARMTEAAPLDRSQETAEGRGVRHLGGALSAPAWSPQLPVQRTRELPTASRDSADWAILSRFSSEDLANGPDIEAETFPESSYTESVAGSVSSRPSRAPAGEGSSPRGSTESGGAEPRRSGLRPFPTPFPPESGGEFGQGDEEAEDDEGDEARAVSSWVKPVPSLASPPSDRNSERDTPKSSRPAPSRSADRPGTAPSEPPVRPGARTGNHGVSRRVSPKPKTESSGTPVIEPPRYGRGPLNYPLPDFSRVEPRVRIPKDSYRPPRGRGSPQKSAAAGAPPLVFKSPAEIVREVLLSGPDGPPAPAAPWRPPTANATVPEEFKCPQQASALVHQLQEDYNRLLTKYAEAENTIDRLRLSAKVSLYADPPKPSHLVHSGAVHLGSKVMTLTFPQAQRAELGPSTDPALLARLGPGQTGAPSDLQPAQACAPSPSPGPGAGGQLTEALARQAERFRLQIDSFEDLLKTGNLKPYEQMKGLSSLQQAQDSLERSYLQAREQQRHLPPQDAGAFDPDREVEGQIFRLGMRLEDLMEQIEQTVQQRPSSPAAAAAPPSPPPMPDAPPGVHSAPTPHPESPVLPAGGRGVGVGVAVEVSSVSGESEEEEGEEDEALPAALPAPLRHKHQRVEGKFSNLLDQYQSFRELPALLDLGNRGRLGDPILGREACTEVSGIAGGEQGRTAAEQRRAPQQKPVDARDGQLGQPQGHSCRQSELSSREPLPQASRFPQQQGMRGASAFLAGGGNKSRSSSLTSVGESGLPAKVPHGNRTAPPQERIVSPETDSGFVGSESSRLTPAVHSPYHQRAGARYPSGGRAQKPSSSAMKCPAPHHRPLVEDGDTVSEVNVGRNALPLPSPSPTSSPQHWASSVTSEFEPETYATLSESEREEDGRGPGAPISCSRPANRQHRQQQSPSPPRPYRHGDQHRAQTSGLLPSRHEAIQALQVEVSRLKQSLEGSLHRTAPPSPATAPPTAREDQQPLPRHSSTPAMRALQREEGRRQEEEEQERGPVSPACRRRSASVPRLRTQRDTGSDSDQVHTLPRPRFSRPVPQSSAAPERGRRSGAVAFRGPYTGRQYTSSVPEGSEDADPRERASSSCPRCSVMTQHQQKTAHHHGNTGVHASTPSPRHCPLCRGTGVHTSQDRERWAESGASAESNSGPTPQRSRPMGSPQKEKRGVFVAAPSPPLLSHVPVVQCVPICTPVVYYPAPLARAPPSHLEPRLYLSVGGAWGGATGGRGPRSRSRHARSLTLDGGSREQSLSLSLSRAISAARGMREASRHMARSLTAGLEQQGALRQPCL